MNLWVIAIKSVRQRALASVLTSLSVALGVMLMVVVLVANGDTVVLGGIFQDEHASKEEKVPWLGDVPGLGVLFRRRANESRKRELLIFVTPSIVEDRVVL